MGKYRSSGSAGAWWCRYRPSKPCSQSSPKARLPRRHSCAACNATRSRSRDAPDVQQPTKMPPRHASSGAFPNRWHGYSAKRTNPELFDAVAISSPPLEMAMTSISFGCTQPAPINASREASGHARDWLGGGSAEASAQPASKEPTAFLRLLHRHRHGLFPHSGPAPKTLGRPARSIPARRMRRASSSTSSRVSATSIFQSTAWVANSPKRRQRPTSRRFTTSMSTPI